MAYGELVGAVSDAIIGVAAIVGSVVAWRGLRTWRDQLRGTTEYELARRVLRGIYKVRDAIYSARVSSMIVPDSPESVPTGATEVEKRFLRLVSVYQDRWNRVLEAHRELDTELVEAEVLWGKDLYAKLAPMRTLEQKLYMAIRFYLDIRNPNLSEARKESIEQVSTAHNHGDVMYDTTEGTDVFADEYASAVRDAEEYLRVHLRRP